ncbi:MAG: peptidyl-prolyl cis-trans isomerase [Verrucomicrobiaceae bacterium]|nr:peptidyl-prolyl cis-trans isomerase [Verrucomicrobiaceae bacterium]
MALIINGEQIDDEIIEAEFRQIKGHYERTLQVACCERDPEFRGKAKDNVTSRALLNQEALKRVPRVEDADVSARLEKLVAAAGGEARFYMNIGMTPDDEAVVRSNVANGARLDKMLQEVYAPEPAPTDAELRAYYDEHIQQFMSEEQIRAVHITKNLQGAQSRGEVYDAMRGLRRRLLAGEDFMKLAEENRLDDDQQIDLGWFKRGEFMEEFEAIAFSMDENDISPVFTTQLGFHIAKVIGRRPPAPLPFEEAKEAVRNRLLDAYRDEKFNTFLEELKAAATIEDTDPEETGCGCGH